MPFRQVVCPACHCCHGPRTPCTVLRTCVGPAPAIIGVGGIATHTDVAAMLAAGADLVQVYTALVYAGPQLVGELTGP